MIWPKEKVQLRNEFIQVDRRQGKIQLKSYAEISAAFKLADAIVKWLTFRSLESKKDSPVHVGPRQTGPALAVSGRRTAEGIGTSGPEAPLG